MTALFFILAAVTFTVPIFLIARFAIARKESDEYVAADVHIQDESVNNK